MEDTNNPTTDNTNNPTTDNPTEPKSLPTDEDGGKSLPVGEDPNKPLEEGEESGKSIEEGEDPHKTLPTREHETKKINEQDHETKANDKAYEEPKEEVKTDLFNLDYFDKPEEASPEVVNKANDLINGDLNYFDSWIAEAEDKKKQNKEQLDAYLKSNVETGNQIAYNQEDIADSNNRINNIQSSLDLSGIIDRIAPGGGGDFPVIRDNVKNVLQNVYSEVSNTGTVSDRHITDLDAAIETINRRLSERADSLIPRSSDYDDKYRQLKREIETAKEKINDIKNNGITKNTGISSESERQQIEGQLSNVKNNLRSAYESGDPTTIDNAKREYERVANRVKQDYEGSDVMENIWRNGSNPETLFNRMEEEHGAPSTSETETPTTTTTEDTTPTSETETPTETETETPETTETETEEETPETPTETPTDDDVIAKADEAKAAYEEAKKREYEAMRGEADETEIAQLAAEAERLRQEWEEAEAEAAALRPREDGEENPEEQTVKHGREDRELNKEDTLPEWVGGDDPHTSSAGAYWAGAFGDKNWSDKVPKSAAQGLINYANDHHDNPFAMFGMTALMDSGGYDALKAGKDVQEMIAAAKDVAGNTYEAIDFFKNGSVLDGIKSILSAGWSALKVLGNAFSAAWNVCKATFSFLKSAFAPVSSAVSNILNTINGYNSVKAMIRDMYGIENTDEVINEIFGDNSETATEQKPVNVLNKTGFSVKGGAVTDESGYNNGLKQKENEIASDACKKIMLYFPYLRKGIL